jgi:hypothetical protein
VSCLGEGHWRGQSIWSASGEKRSNVFTDECAKGFAWRCDISGTSAAGTCVTGTHGEKRYWNQMRVAIRRKMARKFRAFLECREPDGSTKFYKTEKVLASPDLQSRCIEKQVLAKIVRRITAKDPAPPKRLN